MIRRAVFLLLAACSLAAPALACMEPPESTHQREIYLLDRGIETSKRDAGVLAKAKELRARADAAFKAGKIGEAREYRHSALIQIGYKVEAAHARETGTPGVAIAPSPPKGLPADGQAIAPHGCSGGRTTWIPPAE
ncbi:MAG: hypothetical protein ACLP7P_05345 [Rhodomicrobium sp.]